MRDDERDRRVAVADGGRRSKIERVSDKYELPDLGDDLVAYWTGERGEERSLRDLAEYVNHELLRAALRDAGETPLDGEVENTYRLLTADDVSEGMRTQAETTLEGAGVTVEDLRRDFVSHQAVHTYLTKHREVSKGEETDQVAKTVDTIQRLQSRVVAVAENSLSSLRNTDRITLGEFSVLVDVRVFCQDCGRQYDIVDLLRDGGCDCETE